MRFLAGWIAGLATGWAALALSVHVERRMFERGNDLERGEQYGEMREWGARSGRPGYHDSIAGE